MKKDAKRTQSICLRVTPEAYKKVRVIAAQEGLGLAELFEKMIEEYKQD